VGPAYKEMVDDFANAGIARVILGQTLTSRGSDGGGSRALGQVHGAVKEEKIEVDAKGLMMTVNLNLVWPLTLFNFGPYVPPPTWVIDYDPEADLSAISINLQRLWSMGVPMSKDHIYTQFQIPEPKDEEDELPPPGQGAGDEKDGPGAPPDSGVDAAAKAADLAESGGKKKMADVKQGAKEIADLITGAISEGRKTWRRLMHNVVDALAEMDELGRNAPRHPGPAQWDRFFETETRDWAKDLGAVLGEGTLAGYLLGVDQIGWENRTKLAGKNVQFCEAQRVDLSDPIEFEFDQPPQEAIDYFKKKKIVTRTVFDNLTDDARQGSFTVAGVYRKRTIEGFKNAITDALENGTAQAEVIKTFRGIIKGDVKQKELGAWHLENIFRTNIQMAYGVGRRRSLESVADLLPWWTYHAIGDDRTRPAHRALQNVTLRADNPFWESHYPPWAFACRCSVTADLEPPEGYSPVNPTEGVTIAYGEDGAPAKAEIGTQVVDFDAGDFLGVPPQGGLKEALQRGAKLA